MPCVSKIAQLCVVGRHEIRDEFDYLALLRRVENAWIPGGSILILPRAKSGCDVSPIVGLNYVRKGVCTVCAGNNRLWNYTHEKRTHGTVSCFSAFIFAPRTDFNRWLCLKLKKRVWTLLLLDLLFVIFQALRDLLDLEPRQSWIARKT